MTKRLVIIDGKSVFYRGYYAMPGLSTRDGTPTGGVFGFASLALEIMKQLNPDYVAVAWDKKGTSIRRRLEILPTYKAGRKTPPEDFFAQIPLLHELLDACSWPIYEADDYEADDIMGTLAHQAAQQGVETCLITSDLDMLQLVGPLTHVYALKKGFSQIEQYNPVTFEEKYGIRVDQFLDLKALKGDGSDNIPGVPGVGEKTGVSLLQQYQTLDGVYAHLDEIKPSIAKKLEAGKELAYLSQEVAEIWLDAPTPLDLEAMDARSLDTQALGALLERFEFHSLVRRLPKHMQTSPQLGLFSSSPTVDTPTCVTRAWKLPAEGSRIGVYLEDDVLWATTDGKAMMSLSLNEVVDILALFEVVAFDIKQLLHDAHKKGYQLTLGEVHDVRQAAFLIDPLRRDRSLASLVGYDYDEADAGQQLAALWSVVEAQREAFTHLPKVGRVAREFDFPLTKLLFAIEIRGVKIDRSFLSTMSESLAGEYAALEQQMYELAGREFNIASPQQLSEVLFVDLGLPTKGIKKGRTGYSTGQKELDKLRGFHPIIELIERSREVSKLKGTYVDALPLLADENDRLHTTFNQDVAATGRLSSVNPNLQNIPVRSELGRKIRKAFIAEPGNLLVSADYSQFELRLAAVLAGDQALIDDFNGDIDIHTKTASQIYGIPMDDVTKDQRRDAKVINFGVLYGMSPHGLSAATGMSFGEAKQYIDHYFELRAPIRRYIDELIEKAKEDGYVETYFGRRRPTPDVLSTNFMVREGAKRAAANMPIQGTEADLMKRAMLQVEARIGDLGKQILQIHDSILIECPENNADQVAALLREVMESVQSDLGIQLRVDVSTGLTWGDL